jgi:hypothetical protein
MCPLPPADNPVANTPFEVLQQASRRYTVRSPSKGRLAPPSAAGASGRLSLDFGVRVADFRFGVSMPLLLVAICAAALCGPVQVATASSEVDDLRRKIDEQDRIISDQRDQIDRQQQDLDSIREELDQLDSASPADPPPSDDGKVLDDGKGPDGAEDSRDEAGTERDPVGDLNRRAVEEGDFPGAILLPGPWRTSLQIGGFVHVVAIYDSDAERIGAALLPALLGVRRSDEDGSFSIDASLTRLFLDARAPTNWGRIRGYVEWNLNDGNDGTPAVQWRHAYGSLETKYGTALVGQTWSTFMDLRAIPEGLTEPTLSGMIFQRQGMARWTQPIGSSFFVHVAAEDPTSDDVYSDDPDPNLFNTKYPDGVLGFEFVRAGRGHLRLNSLLRSLEINLPAGGDNSELGWGLALSGSLQVLKKDRLAFSSVYGEGLGRYLLGLQANSGASINAAGDDVSLNENWGVAVHYQHYWTDDLRSTVMGGYAEADRSRSDPADSFESSDYASANLMWSPLPYLTLGLEYAYARRENRDGSDLDNHRVAVGFQIF